ncbi:amidohydrolase family protein [Streptomyces sp. NPDC005393]|uniref:amidohydrolase family protein n=1 Tax=Streptomyces sp. NPDC005393 TaxID=3157041 RepID=UPI0033AF94C2
MTRPPHRASGAPGNTSGSAACDPAADVFARRPITGIDVVDAHAHLGPYSRFFTPDPGAEAMIRVMDRCGVRQAILSATLAIELDARAGNDETATAIARHPDRLAGYLTVNPFQDPEEEITRFADHPGMVGVKLHPDLHEYPITGPRYAPVWELAERTGRPVLTHTWTGSAFDDPGMVAEVAERHPTARILLGHCGALPHGYARVIELAGRHPNLYPEICGSYFTGPWLTRMVAELGAHRVVYGSDFPFIDLRHSIGRVIFADLDPLERAAVLGGTIRSLLTPTASQPNEVPL